jgi:broad specificity phosphatase PhoE
MSRLLLVRHGETELNSAERYWGQSDVKLGALGLKQAARLRERLATEKVDAVYASDLKRALVTAETIASAHRLAVTTFSELRELDFGKLEGLNFKEVSQLFPEFFTIWYVRTNRSIDLKYPDGESFGDLDRRLGSFLGRLGKHTEEETVLIVAHYGVLCTLICRLVGLELKHLFQIHLDLASLSIVDTSPQGARLILLNDVSHLDGLKVP